MHDAPDCAACPRDCPSPPGYCRRDAVLPVASVCRHLGEEPVLGGGAGGVINVFFSHCNLQCLYCQNHQISRNDRDPGGLSLDEALAAILALLADGMDTVGFVSPSHRLAAVRTLLAGIRRAGYAPTVIWNSSGYDRHEALAALEGEIDIFLPDFKYADEDLARRLSGAPDYPKTALRALREMYRQKGSRLERDDAGVARGGIIIRHLILPGYVENSITVLRLLAEELSPNLHVSLMSQYHPSGTAPLPAPLDRVPATEEFEAVRGAFLSLGFHHGWVQEPESNRLFLPDFQQDDPFAGRG
jgi:putative pyruvate formate lyase activating enzyme